MADRTRTYRVDLHHRTDGWHWQAIEEVKNRIDQVIGEGVQPSELEATEAAQRLVDSRKMELELGETERKSVQLQ